ncbi:TetR/AcrR family transcriptional regulator [Jidongwangia harbinensis]|uniref:TetR/AcrR family transcriptional regulator n=1 Tax=Jidongwangia harbinensis TaxID=2878561 RepID=UPI001CD9BFB0|nr:TetR/AcrR family transcriptional regulator [Jidongwangia harbinensis]MCA2213613.1 TetR/AcrR family transcriptional regulator [Jidongwangia harbinensis]
MPRPRSLSPDRLAEATVAVVDRDGLGALTMRTVATELGMSTMALYRYVSDRDELELLAVEWVLRDLDTTAPTGDDPPDRLRALAQRVRDTVGAHPGTVPLLVRHRHRSGTLLRWSETVARILHDAGLDGTRRVVALRALLSYLIGALQLEHLGPLSGPGTTVIAHLPEAEFPYMSDTARQARTVPADDEFAGGLDLLLRGLAAG